MPLFGKKAQETSVPAGVPTDVVLQMRYDGVSNNQIIQNLQRQGYDSNQIFDAMTQADMKSQGGANQFPDLSSRQQESVAPSPQPTFSSGASPESLSQEQTEQIVEAMIDEKWSVFEENVKKIILWKNDVEGRMQKMEMNMNAVQQQLTSLQESIFGKVGEYDKHIQSVTTELRALDKVFQKVLPDLAANVSELGIIAGTLKKKQA